jgi:hypothetical protein
VVNRVKTFEMIQDNAVMFVMMKLAFWCMERDQESLCFGHELKLSKASWLYIECTHYVAKQKKLAWSKKLTQERAVASQGYTFK